MLSNTVEYGGRLDPAERVEIRFGLLNAACLRAGGFGILLTSQLVDELVYNERHNQLLFVKYLS